MTEGAPLRVGVFGGSFDPPHLGHALVTTCALAVCELDEVWWVPTWCHAFGKRSADFELRVELCRVATRHFARVRVDEVERDLGGESRTIDTLEELARRHPGAAFSLVIGSDLVSELPRWKRWEDLRSYPIHVIARGDGSGAAGDVRIPDVSSTEVRDGLAAGRFSELEGQLDRAVLERVRALGVYGPG